ncbi:CRE-SLO-1 protein, partial [Aphelenchoides avenae]
IVAFCLTFDVVAYLQFMSYVVSAVIKDDSINVNANDRRAMKRCVLVVFLKIDELCHYVTDRIYDIRRRIRERTFFDVLLLLEVPACLASLTLYFIDICRADFMMDNCVPWTDSHLQQVDIALNAYFFLMWFIRFLHADDVRHCLLHPYSFVFFCVVPPSFLSV